MVCTTTVIVSELCNTISLIMTSGRITIKEAYHRAEGHFDPLEWPRVSHRPYVPPRHACICSPLSGNPLVALPQLGYESGQVNGSLYMEYARKKGKWSRESSQRVSPSWMFRLPIFPSVGAPVDCVYYGCFGCFSVNSVTTALSVTQSVLFSAVLRRGPLETGTTWQVSQTLGTRATFYPISATP